MKVTGVVCLKCGDFIWSRARHDFHWCSCQSTAIDGGFDYMRVCGDLKNHKVTTKNMKCTKQEAYDDWNLGIDKFGWVKERKKAK